MQTAELASCPYQRISQPHAHTDGRSANSADSGCGETYQGTNYTNIQETP